MLFVLSSQVHASNKEKIYNAYINNQMELWKVVIDQMERNKTDNIQYLHELINYQYGYIGYCLGIENQTEAKQYLELAEKNLEKLERNGYDRAIIHSYHSAFWGFKIGINPLKAPFLGRKSIRHANLALEENNKEPFAHVQYGLAYFYMPILFGGSKKIAINHFLKALEQMEANPGQLIYDWNYLSLIALLGQSYEAIKEYDKAKLFYDKALNFEPDFKWVKEELHPNLQRKLTTK